MDYIDYKELYEATFKYAKQLYDAGSYDNETLEAIFPELKESEDEKIKKDIISHFAKGIEGSSFDEVREKYKIWIAWLEKQGEQKPADKTKKCMYSKDDYTDEDRKVLCDGCEEDCKYAKLNTMLDDALSLETKESWNERLDKKEPVSKEWIEELRTKLDSMSKEDFKKVFDKYAINFDEEPVSRTPADIEAAMQEVEEKSRVFTEAHHGEDADTILAQMRGEEPVREALEEASKEWLRPQLDKSYAAYGETKQMELTHFDGYAMLDAIEFGANWQKNYLWKPADGDDLPEYDREVVALLDNGKVAFAHRPNPEGWDAKSIITEKVERYIPETYGKGGWNIQDVKWWLDCNMPKVEED